MKLGSIAEISIECSPAVLLLLCMGALTGAWSALLLSVCALSFHELAHTLMARGLGYRVRSIALQPFGFVAKLDKHVDKWDELCIAGAGPLFSLIAGIACLACESLGVGTSALRMFGNANMAAGCVNLLPALPLDGGRILRAFLFRAYPAAVRPAMWLGVGVAGLLCGCGALLLLRGRPTMLIFGVFLLPAAVRELRFGGLCARPVLEHARRLEKGGMLSVRQIAVEADMRAVTALKLARGGGYTIWRVIDRDLCACGTLDEGQLMRALSEGGGEERMGALVDRYGGKC